MVRFGTEEAMEISNIPISKTGSKDVLVWHHDKRGKYTVRSGYRWLYNQNDMTREIENEGGQVPWKKKI